MQDDKRTVRFMSFNLFIFFVAIYLLTYSGPADVDTCQMRTEVARSLVERSDTAVPLGMGIRGIDGRDYSWFSIGSVLMDLPVYIIGKFAGIPPENLFDMIILLVGAATVVLVFLFSISLNYSLRAALITAIFYGLGTMAWRFSKDSQDHGIETFLILLSVYYMSRYAVAKQLMHLIFSALFLGIAFITRPNAVLVMPSLLMLMIFHNSKEYDFKTSLRSAARNIVIFSSSLLPFISIFLYYNYNRFGSVLETGYGLMARRLGVDFFSSTYLLTGLIGFLASPGQGYFYYSPVALLFFFSIRPFYKRHSITALSFILIMISYLLFYSSYVYWHGVSSCGPRFIFAITPFLIIPVAELFDSPKWAIKKSMKSLVSILFAISLIVQLAGISVHPNAFYTYLLVEEHVKFNKVSGDGVQPIVHPPSEIYFDWHASPLLIQFKLIQRMIGNLKKYRYVQPPKENWTVETIQSQPGMNIFDFWWLYEYFMKNSYSGFIVALSLLSISIFSAMRVWKMSRNDQP